MTHFGILTSFDHDSQTWSTYKSRISQWFIANDITENTDESGTKRRAILLSALADGTYKLAADLALPKNLQNVPYEDIIKLLDEHFTPKRVGFTERYRFYAAAQQADETHRQWAARLRGLSEHCDFSNVEEALRDRFVMGSAAGPSKDKLFEQKMEELTLTKAVELAESVHRARAASTASNAAPQDMFKFDNGVKKITNDGKQADNYFGYKPM